MSDKSPWWVGLIQGVVGIGLGLFMLLNPTQAAIYFGALVAIYLLVAGIIQTINGFSLQSAGEGSIALIQGIVGILVGVVLLAMAIFNFGSLTFAYTILAAGLIVFGGLGIYLYLFQRGDKPFEWGPLFETIVLLVLGVLVFVARGQDINLEVITGWLLIVLGAVVLLSTFLTRESGSSDPAQGSDY